jgi:hypothetical protein
MPLYVLQAHAFFFVRGDNKLAYALVGDISIPAEIIEESVPLGAQGSLQKAVGVINTGMYDFTVATACLFPEAITFFNKQYTFIIYRKHFRDRKADNSGANDGNIQGVDGSHWNQ